VTYFFYRGDAAIAEVDFFFSLSDLPAFATLWQGREVRKRKTTAFQVKISRVDIYGFNICNPR
jgi:hypothetical protein